VTEKKHVIGYQEEISEVAKKVIRLCNIPIPNSNIMDGDFSTQSVSVRHSILVKLCSSAPFSETCKIVVPVVIAGFPFMLFDDEFYQRVDPPPLYCPSK
jgi:hypothetical protein